MAMKTPRTNLAQTQMDSGAQILTQHWLLHAQSLLPSLCPFLTTLVLLPPEWTLFSTQHLLCAPSPQADLTALGHEPVLVIWAHDPSEIPMRRMRLSSPTAVTKGLQSSHAGLAGVRYYPPPQSL